MRNQTGTAEDSTDLGTNTIIIAAVIPSVSLVVLFTLIILAFAPSRIHHDNCTILNQGRFEKRRQELEHSIKAESFYDWLANQKEKHPGFLISDPVCAICLDDFADDAQIRGLRCSHAFHKQCLDDYYCAFVYEVCPLCHQSIIPGARPARQRRREFPDRLPVMFMA